MVQLLQKIRDGDQGAFKQLYHLLFFRLYQFAYSFLRSKESAEEVVNDVFIRLWQKRADLGEIKRIQVYLYVAVKHASLNYLRDNKLRTPVSVDELEVSHLRLGPNPESILITREIQGLIREAIEGLPARCKLIFKLVKEDGLSYKEVADLLDISVKTVDTQLYLALKKLSQSLLPVWTEYGHVTKSE